MSALTNAIPSGPEERQTGQTSGEVVVDTYFPAHNLNISSPSPDEREKEMRRRWRMGGRKEKDRGKEKERR